MKKILIIFTLIIVMSSSIALANDELNQISKENFNQKTALPVENFKETDAVSCGDSLTANTVLTSDLVCDGDGLIIGVNGITLDCNGHNITYGVAEEGIGVDLTDRSNSIVKNCIIIKNSEYGFDNRGIMVYNSINSLIKNNDINTNGLGNFGIEVSKSTDSIIKNNVITNNAEWTRSIIIGGDQENVIIQHNVITSDGDNSVSIEINSDSLYTNISNNTINSEKDSIYLNGGSYVPEYTLIEHNEINSGSNDLIVNLHIDHLMLIDQNIDKYQITNSKIKIKRTDLGEIWFNERMSVSGENLDEDIKIENNNIGIDLVSKPGFNVSGEIFIYGPFLTSCGPPFNPIKDGNICNYPFNDICTNFESAEGTEKFSFEVSEMALKYHIDGTYIPLPRVSANPDFGPVGTDIDVNISWLFANVGDEFTIMFDDYEVGSFNYPDVGYPHNYSFMVEVTVPSIPAGEYEVYLENRTDVIKDKFTVTPSLDQEKKIIKSLEIKGTGINSENKKKNNQFQSKIENTIKPDIAKELNLDSNGKSFYSFYI